MSTSLEIAIALALGILAGLFLGERAAVLEVAADAYIGLLQMMVLPFIVVSMVSALGRLTYRQARMLASRVGAIIAVLWALAFILVCLFPLTLPGRVSASFFSSTLVEPTPPLDLVGLYVPSNPFHALANAVVPAVVLFSIVAGVALIGVPEKARLLDLLDVMRATVARAAGFVTRLVPIGLFAIAAHTAGTLSIEDLVRLQVYVLGYAVLSLLLALWMLPGLVSAVTGIPYRALLTAYRDPLITAFAVSDLFVVLPALTERTRDLIRAHGLATFEAAPAAIVPASFNFPHAGKVLTLTFVLFAAWLADAAVPADRYLALAGTGILSLFGSITVAMPFLLDTFGVPADTFQLFIATGVVNGRFGSLIAVAHTFTVALVGTWAVAGALRVHTRPLVRFASTTAVLIAATVGGTRLFATRVSPGYTGDSVVMQMDLLYPAASAASAVERGTSGIEGESGLDRLRAGGSLTVGYLPDNLPFAYLNRRGALVGFDIDMAHRLAAELSVGVRFVPVAGLAPAAIAGCGCDLVMAGVAVTTDRAASLRLSRPYLDETVALIVPDSRRGEFASWNDVRRMPHLRLGAPDVPYYVNAMRRAMPGARVATFTAVRDAFDTLARGDIDAVVLSAERGSSWTLLYPQLSVVVPEPTPMHIPLAYVIPDGDAAAAALVDTWIDLKRKDGTIQALYEHWILGRTSAARRPRWSILRDVLHWAD